MAAEQDRICRLLDGHNIDDDSVTSYPASSSAISQFRLILSLFKPCIILKLPQVRLNCLFALLPSSFHHGMEFPFRNDSKPEPFTSLSPRRQGSICDLLM